LKRIVSISLVGLLVIAGAGLFFLPRLADGPHQGQLVARQLAELSGQRVQLTGAAVSLWPRPHMVLKGLTLLTADGSETLMQSAEAQLDLSWSGLISGTPEIRQMTLLSPQVTLRRLPSGGLNWNPLQISRIGLSSLTLEGGRLTVLDGTRQDVIENLRGTYTLSDLAGWIELELNGEWQQGPVSLNIHSDLPNAMGLTQIQGNFSAAAAGATGEISGRFGGAAVNWPADGQVHLASEKPGELWNLLAPILDLPLMPADAALTQPLDVTAIISGNRQNYEVRDLNVKLGQSQAKGLVRIVSDPSPGVSMALQFGQLDMAAFMPQLTKTFGAGQFKIPLNLVGAFDVKVDRLKGAPLPLSNVAVKGELKGGTLHFNSATASLPGNANLSLGGTLSTAATPVPLLDLNVALDTAQLRDMLGLMSSTLLGVDDGALQQLKLAANIRGAWGRWGLPDFSVTLDGLQAKGQASKRDNGVWDVRLTADQIDLARYTRNGLPVWLWNLPPLDASIVVRQLRSNTQVAENVILDTQYDGRVLTVKQLNLRTLDGTTLSANGTLGRDLTVPFDFGLKLSTPDFAALKSNVPQAVQLMPELVSNALSGAVNVDTRWRVTPEEAARLAVISLGAGRIDTVVTSHGETDPVTWKARVRHPSAAEFVRMFSLPYVAAASGTLDFYAEGQVQSPTRWDVTNVQGQFGSAQITSGNLLVETDPVLQWEGRVGLASADALDLAGALNLARLAEGAGRLEVNADRLLVHDQIVANLAGVLRFANNQIEAESLKGGWRNGQFTLTGSANFANGLPAIKADLAVSDAEVDWRGGPRFGVNGVMDMHLNAEATGADFAALQSTLAGSGEFSFAGGQFMGMDFSSFARTVAKQREKANIETLLLRGGQSDISAFGGDFIIDTGVVSVPKLTLRSSAADLEGNARLDLKAPRLDLISNITFADLGAEAPPLGMSITGETSNLGASFEVSQLTAFFMPVPAQAAPPAAEQPAADAKAEPKADEKAEEAKAKPEAEPAKKKTNINRKKGEEAAKADASEGAAPKPKPETEAMPSVPDVLNAMRGGDAPAPEPALPAPNAQYNTQDLPDGIRIIRPLQGDDDDGRAAQDPAPQPVQEKEPAPEAATAEPLPTATPPATTPEVPPEFANEQPPEPITQEEAIKRGADGTVRLPAANGPSEEDTGGDAPPSLDDLLRSAR